MTCRLGKSIRLRLQRGFAALESLSVGKDIDMVWENIKEDANTSAKESLGMRQLKQHKPWFDKECLGFLDQRRQAKMQWLQDPSQINVDNLNNVRREVSRHFRNKTKTHLKAKLRNLKLTVRSKI